MYHAWMTGNIVHHVCLVPLGWSPSTESCRSDNPGSRTAPLLPCPPSPPLSPLPSLPSPPPPPLPPPFLPPLPSPPSSLPLPCWGCAVAWSKACCKVCWVVSSLSPTISENSGWSTSSRDTATSEQIWKKHVCNMHGNTYSFLLPWLCPQRGSLIRRGLYLHTHTHTTLINCCRQEFHPLQRTLILLPESTNPAQIAFPFVLFFTKNNLSTD